MRWLPIQKSFLASALVMIALDLIWLGWLGRPIYLEHLGHLMRPEAHVGAAVAFYLLYIVCIHVNGVLFSKSLKQSVARGLFLGFFAYMTFELTSMAVLKDWSPGIILIDIAWGTLLTAAVCGVGRLVFEASASRK